MIRHRSSTLASSMSGSDSNAATISLYVSAAILLILISTFDFVTLLLHCIPDYPERWLGMPIVANRIYEGLVSALPSLVGKTFAITGCTSGTGYHAAAAAVTKGASAVFLLNRPSTRAREARASLSKLAETASASTTPGKPTAIFAIDCDLQSFESVRAAAANVCECIFEGGYGGAFPTAS